MKNQILFMNNFQTNQNQVHKSQKLQILTHTYNISTLLKPGHTHLLLLLLNTINLKKINYNERFI